jgi:hypothetical protein
MRRSPGARRRRGRVRPDSGDAALAAVFRDAYRNDDPLVLARLLGPGVCVVVDTGGLAGAARGPAEGVTASLTLLRITLGAPATLRLHLRSVNGRPGLLAVRDGRVLAVLALEGRPTAVDCVWVVTNPEKLTSWS